MRTSKRGILLLCAALVLLLVACVRGSNGEARDCEENLERVKPPCVEAFLAGEGASSACCDLLTSQASRECIASGAYDDLLSSSVGQVFLDLLEDCPEPEPEPEPVAEAVEEAEARRGEPPWSLGVCLDEGRLEVVWDWESLVDYACRGGAACTSDGSTAPPSVVLERRVDRGSGGEAEIVSQWQRLDNTTGGSGVTKFVHQGAPCTTTGDLSYKLSIVRGEGVVLASTPFRKVLRASEHTFVSGFHGQNSQGRCGSWSLPCRNLGDAIAAALGSESEASVVVLPGEYAVDPNSGFRIENATLSVTGVGGPTETTLTCAGGSGFSFTGGAVALLKGLTIRNCVSGAGAAIMATGSKLAMEDVALTNNSAAGDGAVGGAVAIYGGSDVIIEKSHIFENEATKYGAGVYISSSRVSLDGCTIRSNALVAAGRGAGIAAFADSVVNISHSLISRNEGYFAGAVMVEKSNLTLWNTKVTNNTANYGGGLVFVSALSTIEGSEVEGNHAAQYGGAFLAESAQSVTVRNSTLKRNDAREGGCFYSSNSSIAMTDAVLEGNEARASGGVGAYVDCGSEPKEACHSYLAISDSFLRNNTAVLGGGFSFKSAHASFASVEVSGNTAEEGGGFICSSSLIELGESRVSENRATRSGGAATIGRKCTTAVSQSDLDSNAAPRGGGFHASAEGPAEGLLTVTLHESSMRGNSAEFGGALFGFGDAALFELENSILVGNRASDGGGILLRNNASLRMRNSTLRENTAVDAGGSASLFGAPCSIIDSRFESNTARRGGAISVFSDLEAYPAEFKALAFQDNAALDGSSIYWSSKDSPRRQLACVDCIHWESASSVISTEAVKLGFLAPFNPLVYSTEEVPTFQIGLIDFYDQVALTSPKHLCQLTSNASPARFSDELLISSEGQQESHNGTATYSRVRMEGKIGMDYQVQAKCFSSLSTGKLAMSFNITISGCRPGQEPDQDLRNCIDCKYGYYNFDGISCKVCPQGGLCPGRERLYTQGGWWRPKNTSEELYRCPSAGSCESGGASGDGLCKPGSRGPVCALCTKSFEKWGNTCKKCSRAIAYVLPLAAGVTLSFLVIVVLSNSGLQVDPSQDDFMVRTNLLISYCQVVGRLNYYGMEWTPAISLALGVFDYWNIGDKVTRKVSSPPCNLISSKETSFYETYLYTMSVPVTIVLGYMLLYSLKRFFFRGKRGPWSETEVVEAKVYCCRNILWLLTLVYIQVASMSFEIFRTHLIEDKQYLVSDYNIVVKEGEEGYKPKHKSILAVGTMFLLLYAVGIPLFSYALLKYCRRDPVYQGAVSFLECGYRKAYHYWEVLQMMRDLFISLVPTIFPQNTTLQNATLQTVLMTFLVALLLCQPYQKRSNLILQCLHLCTIWVLISGGVVIQSGTLSVDAQASISSILVFTINFTLIVIVGACCGGALNSRSKAGEGAWKRWRTWRRNEVCPA
ncbi:right-handed beta-helix domain-containing protein [Chloropicon primus]|nr:right-handed beta-helix domain-containing protein [Chloropicon primus]